MATIHVRDSGTSVYLTALVLLILPILSFTGCGPRMPFEYRWFFDLSPQQQHAEMKKFPIEKQIEYYLIGMSYVEPPEMGLADDIAREGKAALPVLMQKLREDKDEKNQVDIMLVLETMHARFYRLNHETEVVNLLRQTTDGMKDAWHKQRGEEILKYIETDQLPD